MTEEQLIKILQDFHDEKIGFAIAAQRIMELKAKEIMHFAAWIEDNHHSFKIPDRILQDYIKYGG